MPIPSPRKGQSQKEFISKCMGDSVMVKEYDQEQRAAICYQKWRDKTKKAATLITTQDDEFATFDDPQEDQAQYNT